MVGSVRIGQRSSSATVTSTPCSAASAGSRVTVGEAAGTEWRSQSGARGRSGGQKRGPDLHLSAGFGEEIEVVGHVHAADQPEKSGLRFVERQQAEEPAGLVRHPAESPSPLRRERARPLALPGPGEERRAQRGGGMERLPCGGADRVEILEDLDLHA